jgi:uncharacterized protein (DUF1697 family)
MAHVVFMRAVNVGGHQTFRPAALAKDLAHLDAVNVGAAGTLVVRGRVTAAKLRAAILEALRFEPELMICEAGELLDLATRAPFPKTPPGDDVRRMLSAMSGAPAARPRLPIQEPAGAGWQVRVVGLEGRFALSFWRPVRGALVDVNQVVEKRLGVSATTRNWNTIEKIRDILDRSG